MRVCFVNTEIFAYTGYSRLNRIVGRELVKRGIEAYVLVPQIKGQRKIEQLDGMVVLGFPYPSLKMLFSQNFFRLPEADIYEIKNPYLVFSYFITQATPKSKHIILFTDPFTKQDLREMIAIDPKLKSLRKRANVRIPYIPYYLYLMYIRPYLAEKTISKGDAYFSEAKFIIPQVNKMHNLKRELIYMPHIAEIPSHKAVKSAQPTVCFLARWDTVKRAERFFELARRFPRVQFIATGRGRDLERDRELREIASKIPNLEIPGVVSEEEKREILERSWILGNTSIHEGLPLSFIEACSYKCAILSAVNPDDFAKNFGYHVDNDNFEAGLEYLLENDRWREMGERGFAYVEETHEINKVIERRIEVYESLLGER